MKKLLAFILAAVMTASLCACGSSKGGAEGSTSAKGSSAAGEAVAASDIKVGCIMIGDENEGYTEAHLKAVEEMKKNLGLSDDQVVIKTNIKEDEGCYDAAVDLAEQGCNIVIANSFGHESYILQAAADYPDVQFCHATGTQAASSGLSNMHNYFTNIYEARYVSGVVAGLKLNEMIADGTVKEDACKIGYVGAFPYAEVNMGSKEQKGDWMPLLFILTDGKPSDLLAYDNVIPKVKAHQFTNIVACAAGPKAKTEPLKKLTDKVFTLDTMDSNTFKKFFQWVSINIIGGGKTMGVTDQVELPAPPTEVNLVV